MAAGAYKSRQISIQLHMSIALHTILKNTEVMDGIFLKKICVRPFI